MQMSHRPTFTANATYPTRRWSRFSLAFGNPSRDAGDHVNVSLETQIPRRSLIRRYGETNDLKIPHSDIRSFHFSHFRFAGTPSKNLVEHEVFSKIKVTLLNKIISELPASMRNPCLKSGPTFVRKRLSNKTKHCKRPARWRYCSSFGWTFPIRFLCALFNDNYITPSNGRKLALSHEPLSTVSSKKPSTKKSHVFSVE